MYSDESFILGLLAFIAGFFLLFFLISVVLYILYGIGMFKITKRDGRADLAWLAWIPIANLFLIPLLVEDDVHQELRGKFTLVFGIVFAGSFLISFFFSPIYILYYVVLIYGFYFVAKRYSKNAIIHVVISAVTLGMSIPISIFMFRNRTTSIANDL